MEDIEEIKPTEMSQPFTDLEIEDAIKSLKNNKSPGIDDINAELLKYGPEDIHHEIASIFNDMAKTGEVPSEIRQGILIPIPKPGKPQGPPANLRPIILLSALRKILSICMINRISHKIYSKIPITQAAYQGGRSTTEHVFTFKCLAEKAITSSNYEIIIEMLDMSKAFDTVERAKLFEILKNILDDDELHLMKILIKDVQLQVRIGHTIGENIQTNIGVPQGDCLSPVLFTLYLAAALDSTPITKPQDHNYAKPRTTGEDHLPKHLKDHGYAIKQDIYLEINQQYADDISWVSNAEHKIENIKNRIPDQLKQYNLHVNESKTEEYKIKRNGKEDWRKCKYLGSLLDTKLDITRRKGLAMAAYNKLNHVFKNKKITTKTKLRVFNTYIVSIFLYNSELWTLTKTLEGKIDCFQRSLLRRLLDIKWPKKVTNQDLYELTEEKTWSSKIKKRRLTWLGHLLRLPENTPARQALCEYQRPVKRPRGKPKTTWISAIEKELKEIQTDLNIQKATELSKERQMWRTFIDGAVSNH